MRARRDELQKQYNEAFGKRELSDEQRLNMAEKALDRAIADLESELASGKLYPDAPRPAMTSPAIEAKRATLAALKASRDEMRFHSGEAQARSDYAAEKAMDRAIANLEQDLAAGKLYSDPKSPRVLTPEMKKKKAELDALKDRREKLREKSGEAQARSDAAFERHLLEREAVLAQRLADNDFMPAAKKPARELTPSMLKVMLSIQQMRQKLAQKKQKWEFDNSHIIYKAWKKGPVAAGAMLRKGLTGFEQSLIGRQGWLLGITHPLLYGKASRKAFASNMLEAKSIFPTEQDLFNTEAELDADENMVRLEKIAKLAVTGVHGGTQKTEENMSDVPEWFDKLPGVGGSERAGSAFINTQRRLVFRELVGQLAKMQGKSDTRSLSSADLRIIGNAVNVASGRGSIGSGKWAQSLEMLSSVFFSPRWWASRVQSLIGAPMWHESRWVGGEGASTEVRMLIAAEWGKQMAAQAGIMTLAIGGLMAAFGPPGEDEEWDWYPDWKSPTFGNIRIGSTYIDMTAGLGQHASLMGRIITGKQVDRWETKEIDAWRVLTNYGRGKLAPVPGIIADWVAGESIGQDPFGSTEWAMSKVAPLVAQDVIKTFNEESIPLSAVMTAMMFFGKGGQTREAKVKARKDIANELRAMRKQGKSNELIQSTSKKMQKALDDHLKHTAAIEAKAKLRTANPEDVSKLEAVIAGTTSPELTAAVEKEKFDITMSAAGMLSSEDGKKDKAATGDGTILTARALLKEIATTQEEAIKLFEAAYRNKYGSLYEIRGGKLFPKKSVSAARRRIRSLYAD